MPPRNRKPLHPPAEQLKKQVTATPLPVQEVRALKVVDQLPVEVTDQRTKIFTSGEKRTVSRFFNDGPDVVMVGGKNVTAASGWPVEPGQGWSDTDAPDADWYAVCDTGGTATLRRVALQ